MTTNSRRLYRSKTDSMLAGVAGGIAKYFDVDPTLIRIAWVVAGLASAGTALIAYIILAIVVPERETTAGQPTEAASENLTDSPQDAAEPVARIDGSERGWATRRNLLGGAIVAIGVLFLLSNLGFFFWWRWDVLWPLALIGIGAALIFGRFWRRDDG